MKVAALFRDYHREAEIEGLKSCLREVAVHIGGDANHPLTVVDAAESARARMNLLLGHWDYPRDADGRPVAFSEVGR